MGARNLLLGRGEPGLVAFPRGWALAETAGGPGLEKTAAGKRAPGQSSGIFCAGKSTFCIPLRPVVASGALQSFRRQVPRFAKF